MGITSVAQLLDTVLKANRYRVAERDSANAHLTLHTVHSGTAWAILRHSYPQHVNWVLRASGDSTRLFCQVKYSSWYFAAILACCALMLPLFHVAWEYFLFDHMTLGLESPFAHAVIFASWITLLFLTFRLITAGSPQRLVEALQRAVESQSHTFRRMGLGFNRKYAAICLTYIVYVLIFLARPVYDIVRGTLTLRADAVTFTSLFALIATLVAALLLLLTAMSRRGATLRLVPLLCGLYVQLAFVLMMCPLLFWERLSVTMPAADLAQAVSSSEAFLHGDHSVLRQPASSPAELQAMTTGVRDALHAIILMCQFTAGATLLCAVLSVAFLCAAVRLPLRTWFYLTRLHTSPTSQEVQRAVTGRGFIGFFRIAALGSWLMLALFCIWLDVSLVKALTETAARLVGRAPGPMHAEPFQWFSYGLSIALGQPGEERLILLGLLISYSWVAIVLLALSLSIGSMIIREHRVRTWLTRNDRSKLCGHGGLQQTFDVLLARMAISGVGLIVVENRRPFAESIRLGVIAAARYVVVSTRCAELLDRDECAGLLAHELAHHKSGHCAVDQLCRFLGRVSCVGDTFMRSLQGSIGYELSADRMAVRRGGVSPDALRRCLLKVHHVAAAEGAYLSACSGAIGIGRGMQRDMLRALLLEPSQLPLLLKVRLGARWFISEYCGKANLAYWHPSLANRVQALEHLSAERYG